MVRAAIYAYTARPRTATKQRQHAICRVAACAAGLITTVWLHGESGDRASLRLLDLLAAERRIEVVMVSSLDRFGRALERVRRQLDVLRETNKGLLIAGQDGGVITGDALLSVVSGSGSDVLAASSLWSRPVTAEPGVATR